MSALTSDALRHAREGASVYRQLRELRRALRAGNTLDALTAAARIHAIAVRPNMRPGDWARAQAACERLLACIPDLHDPGHQPGLRRVVECLHADAARAAREGGDLEQAKLHLITRLGYLRDRHAPVAQQARALIDLAHVYIAAGSDRGAGSGCAWGGPASSPAMPLSSSSSAGCGYSVVSRSPTSASIRPPVKDSPAAM